MITSYAQNFEDVMLWRALKHVENGSYIDLGAQHPVIDSVSLAFYEHGWRGVHVEPNATYAQLLRESRPDETVMQVAVTDKEAILKFYEIAGTGLSTCDGVIAEQHRDSGFAVTESSVSCVTLTDVFDSCAGRQIHWLKIDVEGWEERVLRGWQTSNARPWIVLIESTLPLTEVESHEKWENLLLGLDYQFVYFDGLNRYYLSRAHSELKDAFRSCPNVFDNFVLSGTSSAPFCSLLNNRFALREQELSTQLAVGQAKVLRLTQTLITHEKVLRAQLGDGQTEILRLTKMFDANEQELSARVDEEQAEVLRLTELLDTREKELGAQVIEEQAEVLRLTEQLDTREQELRAQVTQAIAEVQRLGLENAELSGMVESLHNSLSIRITAPLRKVHSFIKKNLTMRKAGIFLLGTMPQRTLALALDFLKARQSFKAVVVRLLAHFPGLDGRLRQFARTHGHTAWVLSPTQNEIGVLESLRPELLLNGENFQIYGSTALLFPLKSGKRFIYYYVDHTILCPVNTGVQRVARCLGQSLLKQGEQIRFVKWDTSHQILILLNHGDLEKLSQWNGPRILKEELRNYPANDAHPISVGTHQEEEGHWLIVPEVTHLTYQLRSVTLDLIMTAKYLGLKTAFIYYDAIPVRRPEFSILAADHEPYMKQLLLADLVIPISQWSATDLVSYFQIHECATHSLPKIRVISLPGESQLGPRVTVPSNLEETGKRILSVGTIEQRKNQVVLVGAFEKFCAEYPGNDWSLTLVGNLHPDVEHEIIHAIKRNSRIKFLGNVQDSELDTLYRSCTFSVFPSVEEGFGLPIIESLWYGKPCICANFGSMKEVAGGGGCLMVNVAEADELFRAITRMTTEPGLLDHLSHEALKRSIATWSDYTQAVIKQIDHESNPINQLGMVYYWVDHTCSYPSNSGIQRVVRGLARALMAIGVKLIPVKWDQAGNRLYPASEKELQHLARWNGPNPSSWATWVDPSAFSDVGWLLIPELTSCFGSQVFSNLRQLVSVKGLRVSGIFYDAIPWKMRDIYPIEATVAHGQYMEELNAFEAVFAISEHSRCDLVRFLEGNRIRTPYLNDRIQTCLLPGEFLETSRVTSIKTKSADTIKILCVGTIEPRKNHLSLLEAFLRVREQIEHPLQLVLVGGSPFLDLAKTVERFIKTEPRICWEKKADDSRLRELYAECDFTVYPSLEEGFGLPILESLWNARPCICRNSGSMSEVAEGGGCLTVETVDAMVLAEAMLRMIKDDVLRMKLAQEATTRSFKTWEDYAREVATRMAQERPKPLPQAFVEPYEGTAFYDNFSNLQARPLLSICITTYNRAEWLDLSLKNLDRLMPRPLEGVEIVVCDNTSTDHTPDVVKPYLDRADFRYYRNSENVGMLGNLRITAHYARGQYIWILGDDDLVHPGSIERILQVIRDNPEIALVYLNYAYTDQDDPKAVMDIQKFLDECTPVVPPGPDIIGPVHKISTQSENFFTAIYCLVFRRDHALQAYSQNTLGRPFSTMLTCIPTTFYVLNYMMNEPACWMGTPQLSVNMNVSWSKYAPIWILERLPEAHDLAEKMGASPEEVDRCRNNHLPHLMHWFRVIFEHDTESNVEYFSASRLVSRMKHLEGFKKDIAVFRSIYHRNHSCGAPGAKVPTSQVFAAFENP